MGGLGHALDGQDSTEDRKRKEKGIEGDGSMPRSREQGDGREWAVGQPASLAAGRATSVTFGESEGRCLAEREGLGETTVVPPRWRRSHEASLGPTPRIWCSRSGSGLRVCLPGAVPGLCLGPPVGRRWCDGRGAGRVCLHSEAANRGTAGWRLQAC